MPRSASPLFTVMRRAAEAASRQLLRDFGDVAHLQVSRKGPADFVSQADQRSEEIIKNALLHADPDSGFLAEESGKQGNQDSRWIIDPLDGTTNFLHGLPHGAISIALEQAGKLVAGLVYDPIKDEAFWAEAGQGAWLGSRRLHVSRRETLGTSLLATGLPFMGHGDPVKVAQQVARITAETAGVRRFGAAALDLAYVAAGRFDAFWEAGLSAWDTAAGVLLVREASGAVLNLEQEQDYNPHEKDETLLSGNPLLLPLVAARLRG